MNPGGSFDIGGSIIKDTLGDKIGEYIGGSFKCSPSIEGLTWESLKSGNFKLPDGCDKEYKITYQTKYGEESDGPILKKDNTFTINPFGNTKDINYKDSFDEGDKDFKYIEKSFTKRNDAKLEWEIKINVPKGGINNLIVKDIPYDMSIDSFEVVGYNGTPTLNQEKNALTFGRVEEGTIILKVITDIGSLPAITKTYTNKSECYDGTDKLGESSASYQYNVENYLSKSANYGSNCNKDEMDWNLDVSPIPDNYQNISINDILPENTQYVDNSLEVYINNNWQKDEDVVKDITVEKGNGTVKFTFTNNAITTIRTKTMRLRYRVKIIDVTKAFEKKEYINTATLILDGKTMSAPAASGWFEISKDTVLKKEYVYNSDTAPNVKYKITVNETASKLNNGNNIVLKDEMGSALDYYMNSMKINGEKATSQQVNYDENTHTLIITIPDEKKVVLEYEATVNLPVGEDSNALNESNAYNKCSLKGTLNPAKLDTQVSLKGKVLESSGSSTGNGVSVKLYKYEKGDQTKTLKDAEFVCSEVSYDDHLNTTKEVAKSSGTTSSNGYLTFSGLKRNQLYKIVETKAPDNYKLDATPKYFIFKGNNKTYPDTITNGGITYPVTCIDESQAIYTCMFENEKGSTPEANVEISKIDAQTKEELEGAHLSIINKYTNKTVDSWVTGEKDSQGKIKTKKITLKPGTYILRETLAPEGYLIASDIIFTVDDKGQVVDHKDNTIVMKDQSVGKLIITKTIKGDLAREKAKDHIKFEVTNNDTGNKETYTLDKFNDDGNIWKLELDENTGGYTVKEVVSDVEGHTLKKTTYTVGKNTESGKEVSVDIEKGKTITVSFENTYELKKYEVKIDKVDGSNEKLSGATLQVLDEAGNEVDSWTTDGTTHSLNLLPGTYALHEVEAPEGYLIASDIIFTVDDKGQVVDHKDNTIVMKDQEKPGKLIITKTIKGDLTKEQAEKSIKFEVTKNNTGNKETYTLDQFDDDGNIWKLELEENAGGYTVKEVVSDVEGYTLKETTYTVGKDTESGKEIRIKVEKGNSTTVAFENTYELTKYQINIDKVDGSNEKLAGAQLQVLDAKGNEVANWTTDGKTYPLYLLSGTYTLHEVEAPEGYLIASDIIFTVDDKGQVVDHKDNTIVMKDQEKPGKLIITKTIKGDLTKEQAEKSIKFEVTNNDTGDKETYTLDKFTDDGNIWKLELEENTGGYTVKELVENVHGYTLVKTTYTIGNKTDEGKSTNIDIAKGNSTTVAFENTYELTKYQINIDKVDGSNEKLAGAQLQVLDKAGNQVDSWTTDGEIHLLSLLPGTYTLHEVEAPKGYLTAEDITFVVGSDGKIVDHKDNTIVMKDQEKPGKLIITKTIKGDLTKEQAEKSIKFEVTKNNTGNKETYTLDQFDDDGNIWKLELEENAGGYTVKEVVSDIEGYTLKETTYTVGNDTESGEKVSVKVEKGNSTTIAFENTYEKVDIPTKEDDTPNKDSSNDQPQVVSNDSKKNQDTSQKNEKQSTKTGDESALLENMALMIVSLFGVLKGCKVYCKKKEI